MSLTAEDVRSNIIEPVILDILTSRADWRYDGPGLDIADGVTLNQYLQQSSQQAAEWLAKNEHKARVYLYWDGENDDDALSDAGDVHCNFPHELAAVAGISVLHSMHADSADSIFEDRVVPYLKTIVKK